MEGDQRRAKRQFAVPGNLPPMVVVG